MENEALIKKVGIELPDDEILIIRQHPSLDELTRGERQILTAREALGSALMQLAYLSYLYAVKKVNDKALLTELVQGFGQHAEHEIYERFKLHHFAIVGPAVKAGEQQQEMASKLVASVYKIHGFHKVYDLLRPLFRNPPTMLDSAYKTLVQEHAQAKHLSPTYNTTRLDGPDHEPRFSSVIRVGNQTATGIGTSKKRAEAAAAKLYCEHHHITPRRTSTVKHQRPSTSSSVDAKRKNELERAASALSLPPASLSLKQFDICMTHISYAEQHPESINNDCLKTIGATVFEVLCFDYVEARYNPERFNLTNEKTLLLKEQCLAQSVPREVVNAFRRGPAYGDAARINFDAIRVEIAKSVLCCIFLNYAASKEESEREALTKLATTFLDSVAGKTVPDYRGIVQEIIQDQHLGYQESYQFTRQLDASRRPICKASITIGNGTRRIQRTGSGPSKQKARDDALKSLIPSLLSRCPSNTQKASWQDKLETDRRRVQLTACELEQRKKEADQKRALQIKPAAKEARSESVGSLIREIEPQTVDTLKRASSEASPRITAPKSTRAARSTHKIQDQIKNKLSEWSELEINAVKRTYGEFGLYAPFWHKTLRGRNERDILSAAMLLDVIPSSNGYSPTEHEMELVEFFRTHELVDELRRKNQRLPESDLERAVELCLYNKKSDFKWKSNRRDFSSGSGTSISRHRATERYKPPTRGDTGPIWDSWDMYIFEQ